MWSIGERKSKQKVDFFTGFDTFALLRKLLIRANLIFYYANFLARRLSGTYHALY
jgi:hypothetical protein